MISFDPDKKRFTQLKEVSDTHEVNQLLDQGFVLLEAGLVKGKRVFLLGKEKISLTHPPSAKEQEKLVEEAVHAIEPFEHAQSNHMPDWLSGLIGMGFGLWLVMVGSSGSEPFTGWGILIRLVGTALSLIGLVQLVMVVVNQRTVFLKQLLHAADD